MVQDLLRSARGHRNNGNIDRFVAHDFGDPVHVENLDTAPRALTNLRRVVIEQGDHCEAGFFEPVVICERPAQTTGAHNADPMRFVQTKYLRQISAQIFDVIPGTAHAELAKVAQVFSNLRRIEIELFRQVLGRDRFDPGGRQLVQTPQVDA